MAVHVERLVAARAEHRARREVLSEWHRDDQATPVAQDAMDVLQEPPAFVRGQVLEELRADRGVDARGAGRDVLDAVAPVDVVATRREQRDVPLREVKPDHGLAARGERREIHAASAADVEDRPRVAERALYDTAVDPAGRILHA